MKLEDQVVSLELSKRLKELGFKQESLFYWDTKYIGIMWRGNTVMSCEQLSKTKRYISAYTVAELVSMLLNISDDAIIITKEVDNVADFLANKLITNYEKSKV